MKLCKDCANVERDAFLKITPHARCARLVRDEICLVTGNIVRVRITNACSNERLLGNLSQVRCGPDAQFFVKR